MLFRSVFVRRIVTVPLILITFLVVTMLAPVLVVLAGLTDLVIWLRRRRPWMWVRAIGFGWAYLLGEFVAIPLLAITTVLPRRSRIAFTYRLQAVWARWLIVSVTRLFSLRFTVKGIDEIPPGPVLVLFRHASLIDTLLPAEYIARPHGMRVQYVLKQELLLDPALDIAGNRLPNAFISRGAGDGGDDRAAIAELAGSAGPGDAVLIYPEGTRFSEAKRDRIREKYRQRGGELAARSLEYENVLPPQPGGVTTMLDACDADVVIVSHRGLEGFARVADILAGDLVGTAVDIEFRRIARGDIPTERSERIRWLFDQWADVDGWIAQG